MAQLELADFLTRAERDEDYGTSLMQDEDFWFEMEQAFLAEVRERVPPRLLADLASAPLVRESSIGRFKGLKLKRAT